MSKKTYQEKLRHPKWQKLRLEIMKRDKFMCKMCKDEETTLNVHHLKYTAEDVWDEPKQNLITVCEHCHLELESLKSEHDDIDIKNVRIEKSNNWQGGSRIMFISCYNVVSMRIFDKENNYIIGFNFGYNDISKFKKIAKFYKPKFGEF